MQFQQDIAKHFYATGTSFQFVEDVHLFQAVRALRSDCDLLPRRKQLATTLLDQCYAELLAKVNTRMLGAIMFLTTDAWTNIKNDSIVNYMAVAPDSCIFLESMSTGQQEHDHKFIADDIARVIRKYEKTAFAGAVTDNTSTNKKAWRIMQYMFPSSYFQGCTSHGLHHLVRDVFGATENKKVSQDLPTYPEGYPFKTLQEFVQDCKTVVKFFHNHHVPKAQLRELQKTTKSRMLVRVAPTRWSTIQGMTQSLLDSDRHLHALVSARDLIKGTAAQKAERLKV
jgi:Protein of unknown function (DUF 659)